MIIEFLMIFIASFFSVAYLVYSSKRYKHSESSNVECLARYAPVQEEISKLNQIKKHYQEMRAEYSVKRVEYKEFFEKCTFYNLGVGTTDSSPYQLKHSKLDINGLESLLKKTREKIKALLKAKKACVCNTEWILNDSRAEGRKATNREIKLRLKSLDNTCKAALTLVDWNNINRLKARLVSSFKMINETSWASDMHLMPEYLAIRIEELEIKYELDRVKDELKENERAERQIQREAEREEKKIQAAANNAKKEREFHEKLVASELEKLKKSSGDEFQRLQAVIKSHQTELEALISQEKRALSMAQQTRAGYVYVISNVSSFSQSMCKIGMTRRVDPNDRVKELGDASVPELFDVHAFVYSEDAPALEKELHKAFTNQRVNLVNKRKEFFFVEPTTVIERLDSMGLSIDKTVTVK